MTEAEWLAWDRARPLLNFLRDKVSDRKLRLFACACWREWRPIHSFPDALRMLEAIENFADGIAIPDELKLRRRNSIEAGIFAIHSRHAHSAACRVSKELDYRENGWILRDLIPNPFRPVAFGHRWRSETAVALASSIYAERAFDHLPVLADALEEAGCDQPDVLAHCRGPGPHARGCWVVDLVLNKS